MINIDIDAEITNANRVKTIVLQALASEGFLTSEKAIEFEGYYSVVIHKKGWFSSLLERWFGLNKKNINEHSYTVMKIVAPSILPVDKIEDYNKDKK